VVAEKSNLSQQYQTSNKTHEVCMKIGAAGTNRACESVIQGFMAFKPCLSPKKVSQASLLLCLASILAFNASIQPIAFNSTLPQPALMTN
jgi:hypothetical protein